MKKILFVVSINCVYLIFANNLSAVPTLGASPTQVVDEHQKKEDKHAIRGYRIEVVAKELYTLGKVMDVAGQIASLQSLQDVSKVGNEFCQLCSKTEQQQLQTYVNQVNDDLCSQFSQAMKNLNGIESAVTSIQAVITALQRNPKQAGLALQSAALQTQAAMQSTLIQVQALIAQREQKHLAEQKLEKQNSIDIYAGFGQSGL